MKIKGVGPIEQNADKIVLGVVGIVFLAVLATQFLSGPTTIADGTVERPLRGAYSQLEQQATSVIAQMDQPPTNIPSAPAPVIEDLWAQATTRGEAVELAVAMGAAIGPGAVSGGDDGPATEIKPDARVSLQVNTPGRPFARVHRGTLHPGAWKTSPELQRAIREVNPQIAQPFDIAGVTVEFNFDGRELSRLLASVPQGGDEEYQPIPPEWYTGRLAIMRVELEREEFDPSGSSLGITSITELPGRSPVIAPLSPDAPLTREDQNARVNEARLNEQRILRPDFLAMIAGDPWLPPSALVQLESIETQRRQITTLLRNRASVSDRLATARNDLEDARRPGSPGRPTPDRPTPTPRPGGTQDNPEVLRIRALIERLEADLASVDQQLNAIGVDSTGTPIPPQIDLEFSVPLLDDPARAIWAHDVLVREEHSYRYRARVVLNSPLFGRAGEAAVTDEQAKTSQVTTEWSQWSEPITIQPAEILLVTSTNLGDEPSARVEAFRFFYGYWRAIGERRGVSIGLLPGDRLISSLRLPDPSLLPIYNMDAISETGQLPEVAANGPTSLVLRTSIAMLDIASDPIRGDRVYFATPDGRLLAQPVISRDDPRLAMLWSSAERGLRQGAVPEALPEQEAPQQPDRPQPRDAPPGPFPDGG